MFEINIFHPVIRKQRFNPENALNKQTHHGLDSHILTHSNLNLVRIQKSYFVCNNLHIQTNNQNCKIPITAKKRYRIS